MISPRRLLGMALLIVLSVTGYGVGRLRRDVVDFEVYQTAGARVLHAEPLYRDEDGHFQYKYLPAFALAMTVFAYGDIEVWKAVWFAINIGWLVWFFQQSVTLLPERRRSRTLLYTLIVILSVKFIVKELVNGQTNLMLGVFVMAGLAAALRGRPKLAGVWIAAAVFVKPYALIMVPWMMVSLEASALVAFGAATIIGLLLPAAIYGWSGNIALLAGWFHGATSTTAPNLLIRDATSLAAMWAKWIGPGPHAQLFTLITSMALVAVAIPVWLRRRGVAAPAFLEVGLLLLMVPLLSPQGWDYVFILGAPAIVCLVDRWRDVTWPWRIAIALSLFLMCLLSFDTVGQRWYMVVTTYSIVTIGGLASIGCLTRLRFKALA